MNRADLLVNTMIELLHSEDVNGFVHLFVPNAELILPNAYCVGHDAIQAAVRGMYQAYDQISIELDRVFAQGNLVCIQWQWCDRHRLTSEINETDTAIVLELSGNKIQRWREYHAPVC